MNNTVRAELENHVQCLIEDGVITDDNIEDWHNIAFNTDYYIIGYYAAQEWLSDHNVGPFQAIAIVRDYEMDNFGEFTTPIHSEAIVNMYVYIMGLDLFSVVVNSVEDLLEATK